MSRDVTGWDETLFGHNSWTRTFARQFAFCSTISQFYSAILNFKPVEDSLVKSTYMNILV